MAIFLRKNVTEPECLINFQKRQTTEWSALSGTDLWGKVTSKHKRYIRKELLRMQSHNCMYCGCNIVADNHIEHFAPKSVYKHLVYTWSNLFLSCELKTNCGHYKNNNYSTLLIKPDEDDLNRYFSFHRSGKIKPSCNLSPSDQHRANETISILNLNSAYLVDMRQREILSVIGQIRSFYKAKPDQLQALLVKLFLKQEGKELQEVRQRVIQKYQNKLRSNLFTKK